MVTGYAELQAFCDPARPLDKVLRRPRRADFAGGIFEQGEPAAEVFGVDR